VLECSSPFFHLQPQVGKPLKSVTHGQCDGRPKEFRRTCQRKVPLFLEIHKFPYNTESGRWKEASEPKKTQLDSSSRFDAMSACDGQTEHDDSIYRASTASRGNKQDPNAGNSHVTECGGAVAESQAAKVNGTAIPRNKNNSTATKYSVSRLRYVTRLKIPSKATLLRLPVPCSDICQRTRETAC